MKSILEEFAYGSILPGGRTFKWDSEFAEAMSILTSCEKKLLDTLNADEKALYEKYTDAQGEIDELTAVKSFIYGYKLGLLMTAEAFITGGDLISG